MRIYNKKVFEKRRRELRKNQTEAEKILWQHLRGKKMGYRFWRQYGTGQYIIDFYSPALHMAIELDGSHHLDNDQKIYDRERDDYLRSLGIQTLRFQNEKILTGIENVITIVKKHILSNPPLD